MTEMQLVKCGTSLVGWQKENLITYGVGQRRQWHPTPVLLPGESQGRGSLVGCHLWGLTESDTTEGT